MSRQSSALKGKSRLKSSKIITKNELGSISYTNNCEAQETEVSSSHLSLTGYRAGLGKVQDKGIPNYEHAPHRRASLHSSR